LFQSRQDLIAFPDVCSSLLPFMHVATILIWFNLLSGRKRTRHSTAVKN